MSVANIFQLGQLKVSAYIHTFLPQEEVLNTFTLFLHLFFESVGYILAKSSPKVTRIAEKAIKLY